MAVNQEMHFSLSEILHIKLPECLHAARVSLKSTLNEQRDGELVQCGIKIVTIVTGVILMYLSNFSLLTAIFKVPIFPVS